MSEDRSHFLNELAIWKLKIVAAEHKIDVSDCKYKRDFVEKIAAKRLTEEQIRSALKRAQKRQEEDEAARQTEREVQEIGLEVEAIANKTVEPKDIPQSEEEQVEKYIDETLMSKPTFFEIDGAIERAYSRMIVGDFPEAIKANREARVKCLEAQSSFNVYSSALSIRAADMLLPRIALEKGEVDSNLKTALAAAKKAFISGPPRRREETLADIETLVLKAHEALVTHAAEKEEELSQLLAEYESFGALTQGPRKLLEVAKQARQTLDMKQHGDLLESAAREAEKAKEQRTMEVAYGLKIATAAAGEAKVAGVNTSEIESDLAKARKAFDEGSFRKSIDLYMAAERAADQAHIAELRKKGEPESAKLTAVGSSISASEAILFEGGPYGMNVEEGLYYTGNARNALSRRDVVGASKFARLARVYVDSVREELEKKRIELGVAKHMGEAKCGKCGKKSLYSHPDGTGKCRKCGHSFALAGQHTETGASEPERAGGALAAEAVQQVAAESKSSVAQPAPEPALAQQPKKKVRRMLKK